MTTIDFELATAYGTASTLHDPGATIPACGAGGRAAAVRTLAHRAATEVRGYYGTRQARLRLAATSLTLSYVGGAAMFWLHAIYRGEQGPPIANAWHWMIDSSLGLVGLAPVLLVLLPLARALAAKFPRAEALLIGGLFALVTTPGPFLHYSIAGPETPLARLATSIFGSNPAVIASHVGAVEHSLISESLLQLVVGLPVYVLLAQLLWSALPFTSGTRTDLGKA